MNELGQPVVYLVVCDAPIARQIDRLVALAQRSWWEVAVVAAPDALVRLDLPSLREKTGYAVRSYINERSPDVPPPADAIVVAPASSAMIAKCAAGIIDSLAISLVVHAFARNQPVVCAPYVSWAELEFGPVKEAIGKWESWGGTVLLGEDGYQPHQPEARERHTRQFPWPAVWQALLDHRWTPKTAAHPADA